MRTGLYTSHRQAAIAYFVTFGAGSAQILSSIILMRLAFNSLDLIDLKIWFVVIATMPVFSLMELGANTTLLHRLSHMQNRPSEIEKTIASFLLIALSIYTVIVVISFVLGGVATYFEFIDKNVFVLGISVCFVGIFRIIGNILQASLYAIGDNEFDKALRIFITIAMCVATAIGLVSGFGVYSLLIGWCCSALISICMCIWRLITRWDLKNLNTQVSKTENILTFKNSLKYLGFALPGLFIYNSAAFIIAIKLTPEHSVLYGLTQQIIGGVALVVALPATIAMPKLASLFVSDRKKSADQLLSIVRTTGVIAVCSMSIIWFSQEFILHLWLGGEHQIPALFLALYFLAMFFEWQQSTLTAATMATGNFRFVLVTIISSGLVLVLMPNLINVIGFIGVPISIILAQAVTCHYYNIRLTLRTYDIKVKKYIYNLFSPVIACIIILIIYLISNFLNISKIMILIISIIASIIIFYFEYKNLKKINEA